MRRDITKAVHAINAELQTDIKNKAIAEAPDTTIAGVRVAVLEGSDAARVFNTLTLQGQDTEQPIADLPNDTQTDFTIGGLEVERDNVSTVTAVTDETIEDSSPAVAIQPVLEQIVANQIVLKVEDVIADTLDNLSATETGQQPKSFQAIKKLLQAFDDRYTSLIGRWYVFVSHDTLLEIYSVLTTVQLATLDRIGVDLVPVYNLADDQMILAHSLGIAGGFNIRSIEYDRQGGMNESALLLSASAGASVGSNYYKKTLLA